MPNKHILNIRELIKQTGHNEEFNIIPLPVSGSNRSYFRAIDKNDPSNTILASYNEDVSENIAQFSFTQHFRSKNLRVPEILAKDSSYKYFLLEDLGKRSLFDIIKNSPVSARNHLINVVKDLIKFQIDGFKGLDMDVAYPVSKFDTTSILWDLNYFKYYFVKPHNISFNELKLEEDFKKFTSKLLEPDNNFFVYRDFQSRNIIIKDELPWYIDFQGGRQGPLQYDLVSLLNQVKANLPESLKIELREIYLQELEKRIPGSSKTFMKYYHEYEYFRLIQVMGAYGFRGLVEKKAHFLQSLIPAISALQKMQNSYNTMEDYPELKFVLEQITQINKYSKIEHSAGLNVSINSFSFKKKGIPLDMTGNGGGHVFDCRSLPNPGRLEDLRDYTGLEIPVINYLEKQPEVSYFIENAKNIIWQSIDNYLERGFLNLQINFGCTGGRHRSVYSATLFSKLIKEKYPEVNVTLHHNELDQ